MQKSPQGILLVDKPRGKTSFSLIRSLRKKINVKKIGHTGTLDPFATGLMVLLVGRDYTRLSDQFLNQDKEYVAEVNLGVSTDTYDCDGEVTDRSDLIPTQEEIEEALKSFQGQVQQVPPMYSAKKVKGQKLYQLARRGEEVEREPVTIELTTTLIDYNYPLLNLHIRCSKGSYVRAVAHDLGQKLGCGAHLTQLNRTRSGSFHLKDCISGEKLFNPDVSPEVIEEHLLTNSHLKAMEA